ncbi:centrosomal protein of 44 kDa isoform X1 [Anguilla rostrata]|uniref:centrosomal protein of 44 kDa isoform X1 n=1 Tax=Anguilla rostrata TaxID=7938 RepID=UPI0030CCBA81
MTTGDLRGCLRKLELHLRSLKYPKEVDYAGLAKGDSSSFLPVLNYAFLSHSSYLAEELIGFGVELAGKNDHRFLEAVYKVLRDVFNYKPLLTKEQFLQFGFAERKIGILCDIIGFVTERHRELSKNGKTKSKPRLPRFNQQAEPEGPHFEADALKPVGPAVPPPKPLVERHMGGPVAIVSHSSSEELSYEDGEGEEEDENESSTEFGASPQVESRLQALEAQVLEYQRKLETMSLLEDRLKRLERDTAGKIVINQQDWDNLESRVLLLETRLALSSSQKPSSLGREAESIAREIATIQESSETSPEPPPPSPRSPPRRGPDAHAAAINPFVLTADPKENIKERLERIATMMNETSSLLRSTEPSIGKWIR